MSRSTTSALLIAACASAALAGGTGLKAVSRPDRHQGRIAYTSSDAGAGLAKGGGTDPGSIRASVFLADENGTSSFDVPAGAYDGTAGWTANDAARASFRNRAAPGGPTDVRSFAIVAGRKLKLDAKSLGDTSPLTLTAPPAAEVTFGSTITNDTETTTHCTRFAPANCTYASIDGGTGWKLRCRGGIADPTCGAIPTTTTLPPPVCGNGIREAGEECDGGALCTSTCRQELSSCCGGAGTCTNAPVFSLLYYLFQYCSGFLPGSSPQAGDVCGADGACADLPIEPVHLCCQLSAGCSDTAGPAFNPAATTSQLYYFLYYCNGGAGLGSGPSMVVNAACGPEGSCVPN